MFNIIYFSAKPQLRYILNFLILTRKTKMSANDRESVVKYLEENLLKYPDFPKPGIVFRDTFSLFRNPDTFKKVIDLFSDHIATLGN